MTNFTCIFYIQKEDSTTTLYKTKCRYLKDQDKPFTGYRSYIEDSILYIPYCPYYIKINIPEKMVHSEPTFASILDKRTDITCDFFSDNDLESICLKNISFNTHEENLNKTGTFCLFLKMDILMNLKNVSEEDILKITEDIPNYSIEVSNS